MKKVGAARSPAGRLASSRFVSAVLFALKDAASLMERGQGLSADDSLEGCLQSVSVSLSVPSGDWSASSELEVWVLGHVAGMRVRFPLVFKSSEREGLRDWVEY